MEYMIDHVDKALHSQTPHASLVLEQMKNFHHQFKAEKRDKYECMCTFVAFGNSSDRTLLLTCLEITI